MDTLEQRALEAIDRDALLKALCDLIAIQSVGGQESPAQEQVADLMRAAGLEVDTWDLDLDRLRQHPAHTVEIERDRALGVIGRMGADDGPTLILNGHTDVVPAGELERWTYPPWKGTIDRDRIYGRGAADMKGGLCCALFAMKALRDAGVSLSGTVVLQSVVGEEDGGVGTLAAVERGYTGDAAIVTEPTELRVAPAQAGAFNFRITVPGKAAHGALRAEGNDPIDAFIPLYRALQHFERRRNQAVNDPLFSAYDLPFALCIGTVRAGIWASTVAESLVCEGRLGISPHEDPGQVREAFETIIQETAHEDAWLREHPPTVEWWGAQFAPAQISADHPIVSTAVETYRTVTGQSPTVCGMPYGADMRLLVHEGQTPTILFGPGDVRVAHAPDEHVPIDELFVATKTLVLTILRFCGVDTAPSSSHQ